MGPLAKDALLARDALGIKPLYIARATDRSAGWTLAFASEVRTLLASGLLGTPRLEPSASASLVWNGFVVGPQTAVQGVESLVPGQLRLYADGGAEQLRQDFARYPRPPKSAGPLAEEELAFELQESVRLHLIADVPLGVFLSSGIDSSAIANLAHKANRGPVHTFTLAFEEQDYNEGRLARRIAESIGTEHQEVLLTEADFVGRLDEALDSLDQPTFDGLNSFYMSHAVREAGFTVALVGTGGDELFGGYTSFRDLPALHRWCRFLPRLPRAALAKGAELALRTLQRESDTLPRQTRWAKLPDMVRQGNELLRLYQLAYALFLPDFQEALLGEGAPRSMVGGLPAETRSRLEQELEGRSDLAAISALEQRLFLGERLLRDNDAASMAASIEQRLPFVDEVLLQQRGPPSGRAALPPHPAQGGVAAHGAARPRPGALRAREARLRPALRQVDSAGAEPRPSTTRCATVTLSERPASSPTRWCGCGRPSSPARPAFTGLASGPFTSWCAGAGGMECAVEWPTLRARHPLPRRSPLRPAHARRRAAPDGAAGAVGDCRRRLEGRDASHSRRIRATHALLASGAAAGPRRPQGGGRRHRRLLRRLGHARPAGLRLRLQARLGLGLAPGYFAGLMDRMEQEPRIGTASGKPYSSRRAPRTTASTSHSRTPPGSFRR